MLKDDIFNFKIKEIPLGKKHNNICHQFSFKKECFDGIS